MDVMIHFLFTLGPSKPTKEQGYESILENDLSFFIDLWELTYPLPAGTFKSIVFPAKKKQFGGSHVILPWNTIDPSTHEITKAT